MSKPAGFNLFAVQMALRFIQGYRYLDLCGECLIRLEESLDEQWIPVETLPTSGSMKNDSLGMTINFNSEGMAIRQAEFLYSDSFRDQTCKAYETLWRTLGIERINAPAMRLWYQMGFDDDDEANAEKYLLKMSLCETNERLLQAMGGEQRGVLHTVVTEQRALLNDSQVTWRRRFQANVIRQARQQNFDARFLQRTKSLHQKQREAIQGLMVMKKRLPDLSPIAIQLETESTFDMEFSTKEFSMSDFILESEAWSEKVKNSVVHLRRS